MPREIDDRKTRKALRALKKAREAAERADGPGLSEWERDFVEGVTARLNTYGSAFRDLSKGAADEPLSERQAQVVASLKRKAKKPSTTAKQRPLSPAGGEGGAPVAEADGAAARPARRAGLSRKPRTPPPPRGRDIHGDLGPVLAVSQPEPPASASAPPGSAPPPSWRGGPPRRVRLRVIEGGRKA